MRAARRRAVRRRSDSMSSTLPCRWTETSPVNPFNREEGINNPSLVCRSLLKAITSEHGLKNSRVSRRTQPARLPSQVAQKDQTSHPPNPGAPRRTLSQARPQGVGRLRRTCGGYVARRHRTENAAGGLVQQPARPSPVAPAHRFAGLGGVPSHDV